MRFLAPSRPPPLLNPYCSGLGKGVLVVEYAIARNLSGESKKVFLAARKAAAAQRERAKTTFFAKRPSNPAQDVRVRGMR